MFAFESNRHVTHSLKIVAYLIYIYNQEV